ncbi:hypothetical protein [Erythrobacter rubeus]|uniref:DUF4239 domain-containing protein n=1 Tax=Erythrobacter rubeus TaxID=2760803 RepID=A0ABR8KNU8_9SPHN|nr:hypothetical protein [Erythrobacter rubeus]MBD2841514.1 hypothetical protein [Erythrobacter rubeus]
MSISTSRPDNFADTSLHQSEEYRRAKRNVLLWGVLTVVVATGTAGSEDIVGLGSLTYGLSFSPKLLVLGSCFILAFMTIGYWRAEQRMLAHNTPLMRASGIGGEIDALRELSNRANTVLGALEGLEHKKDAFSLVFEQLNDPDQFEKLRVADQAKNQVYEWENFRDNVGQKQRGSDGVTQEKRIRLMLKDIYDWVPTALTELTRKQHRLTLELVKKSLENADQNHPGESANWVSQVGALASDITGFADAIGERYRRYFFWHDRFPVIALTIFAIFIAAARLFIPQSFYSALDYAFPSEQVEQASSVKASPPDGGPKAIEAGRGELPVNPTATPAAISEMQ